MEIVLDSEVEEAAIAEAAVLEEQASQAEMERAADTRETETAEAERSYVPIEFDDNGSFTLQVESWRSEESAIASREKWRNRGFEHAFVVQYGDESIGDVWFRVRLGRFASLEMAERQRDNLRNDFNMPSWIDME